MNVDPYWYGPTKRRKKSMVKINMFRDKKKRCPPLLDKVTSYESASSHVIPLHVYIYIYMCVYIYIHIYIYTYIFFMYIYICVYLYIYISYHLAGFQRLSQ